MEQAATQEIISAGELAEEHCRLYAKCGYTILRYARETRAVAVIPEQLATKIRAQLCEEGKRLFDRIAVNDE